MKEGLYIKIIHKCLHSISCLCVLVCVCNEMAILWKVKQASASPLCPVPWPCAPGGQGAWGPRAGHAILCRGPPGPYWSLDVKLPPPTRSWIFASQSVLKRRIGVMRFLKQLVWMFHLIDSQFLQGFMLWPFSSLHFSNPDRTFYFPNLYSWQFYFSIILYYTILL